MDRDVAIASQAQDFERGSFWTAHHLHIFLCALDWEPYFSDLLHTMSSKDVSRLLASYRSPTSTLHI